MEHLSLAVAIVLIFSYVAGLVFSLRTHRALFNPPYEEEAAGWSVRRASSRSRSRACWSA